MDSRSTSSHRHRASDHSSRVSHSSSSSSSGSRSSRSTDVSETSGSSRSSDLPRRLPPLRDLSTTSGRAVSRAWEPEPNPRDRMADLGGPLSTRSRQLLPVNYVDQLEDLRREDVQPSIRGRTAVELPSVRARQRLPTTTPDDLQALSQRIRPRARRSSRSQTPAGKGSRSASLPGSSRTEFPLPQAIIMAYTKTAAGSHRASCDRRHEAGEECQYSKDETFIPYPKITFLIDRPDNLTCQICTESKLQIGATVDDKKTDTTPVLLPCGHIAGQVCMREWLKNSDHCPFCRMRLDRPACHHNVKPQAICYDTFEVLPPTLSAGGLVGDKCQRCARDEVEETCFEQRIKAKERFEKARATAARHETDEAKAELKAAATDYEQGLINMFCDNMKLACKTW